MADARSFNNSACFVFFALLLEGFRIISFLLFMLIGILQIACEDKGNR